MCPQAVQDVIVELQYQEKSLNVRKTDSNTVLHRSIYMGWTGMQSKRKSTSIIDRDGGRGSKEETAIVEIDMTFARTIGLVDFQKVYHPLQLDSLH